MERVPDTTAADWLLRSGTPDDRLITFGPAGFEAYARLRFIRDPRRPDEHEADVDLPEDHPADLDQSRRVLHQLTAFTSTPWDCYFCLWEGYSNMSVPPGVREGALVELPHRRFALFRGPLRDIDRWSADFGGGQPVAPPAFVWPADHRWCFTSDVDPHWAGIGADRAVIDVLLADPWLDIVPADPTAPPPTYR